MIERLFFELMQVAVGSRSSLSRVMTKKEWEGVYACCLKQTLVGMGYVAIQKLPKAQWPPSEVVLKFTAMATRIKSRNELLDKTCVAVCQRMDHDGLDAVILKGQANSINYPETLLPYRMPGDIDVWARPKGNGVIPIASKTGNNNVEYIDYSGVQAVIEYVRMQHRIKGSSDRPPMRYHHIDAPPVNGIPVEVHFRPSYKNSPIRNWRMQNWYKSHMDLCVKNKCNFGFPVLTSSINVVYLMDHLFRHYFVEGLGLRQLMDYYFALRVWHNDVMECKDLQSQGMWSEGLGTPVMSKEEVMAVLRSFGMKKFAGAVMYVLHEVFAIPTNYYICEPNEKEGRKLLEEIMKGGNFGQYDERGKEFKNGGMIKHGLWKLKRVMRLVRSYPEEALWEPVFRVYHLGWRMIHY